MKRRSSAFNTGRLDGHYQDRRDTNPQLTLHFGDVTDTANLARLIQQTQPHEIYNLAAQSHVQVSFELAEYTADVVGLGALRLLEAIRLLKLEHRIRFYQASSSEMFGAALEMPQRETTPFNPRSPYAAAKVFAHNTIVTYRLAYGMHASNGILFNHESPLRGETFVTRKITRAAAAIALGRQQRLYIGNLDARRDWGHAREYVEGMWLMLQQDEPDDYVLATGVTTSVRDFVTWAFAEVGLDLSFKGSGVEERGYDQHGNCVVEVDPRHFRPAEVDVLLGDASKARQQLGWTHRTGVRDLVREMVAEDLALARSGPPPGA